MSNNGSVPVWAADVEMTQKWARLLLESQFPTLAPMGLRLLGEGWDNTAFLVNETWVFRFPRRQMGARLLAGETQTLLHLANQLPLLIPYPQFTGRPEGEYPYLFTGYACLSGQTACAVTWTDDEREAVAPTLARFLRTLHEIPVDTQTRAWAPSDEIRRSDIEFRANQTRERMEKLKSLLDRFDREGLKTLLDRLASTPGHTEPTCWVHGDLYPRHLLVNDAKQVCGVIDWGDAHLGDPALDLSIAWSFLPPKGRERFLAAYGNVDAATWQRAQLRAVFYGAVLFDYGAAKPDATLRTVGEYALRNVLT